MMDSDAVFVCVGVGAADASEDSMESSEEMVTPRAAASEADEEERKAAAAEVLVECATEADGAGSMVGKGDLFVCMGSMQTEWRMASNGDMCGK